jgi:DNA polymerase III subunit delta'
MQFDDITGQETTKRHLTDLVKQNRLSHALLFLGKEGGSAMSMALAFSQFIVCSSPKTGIPTESELFGAQHSISSSPVEERTADSCGHCEACIKAGQFIHPDIHFSFPVISKKSGSPPISDDYIYEWREFLSNNPYGNVYDWLQFIDAENKQGNITVEECNSINHKLSLKSFESRYKILIMWMPEFLGTSGNKLLKLIEEPPPDTLFIFVAQDENGILPTILSRTQLIRIPSFTNEEIKRSLMKSYDATEDVAARIAGVSEGNLREAFLLFQNAAQDWEGIVREWLNVILKKNIEAQIKWIDQISQLGREKQKQFLRYFIHLLGQALRFRFVDLSVAHQRGVYFSENEKDFSIRINRMCSVEAIEAIIEEFNKSVFYIERNANPKLLFHALSIRLFYIVKDNSLILMQ